MTTLLSSPRRLNKTAILLVQHRDIPLDCHCFQEYCHDHYLSPQKIVLLATIKQLFCSQPHWTTSFLSCNACKGKDWGHLFFFLMQTIHHTWCSSVICALPDSSGSNVLSLLWFLYPDTLNRTQIWRSKVTVHLDKCKCLIMTILPLLSSLKLHSTTNSFTNVSILILVQSWAGEADVMSVCCNWEFDDMPCQEERQEKGTTIQLKQMRRSNLL